MRKLVVNTFTTLDGVMQAPGGPEEDPAGGFEHGGWSVGYWDEAMGEWMGEFMGKPFDLVLGRKTYEIFAAHWPHAREQPGAEQLNAATKYVASRTLDTVDWENSRLLEGDVADAIARLKEQDGPELQVHAELESDPDAAAAWPGRRVPRLDLPGRSGQREAPVRRRHGPGRSRARRLEDVDDGRRVPHVHAGRTAAVRVVCAGRADRGGARAAGAARRLNEYEALRA